jgi:hypothetical protein
VTQVRHARRADPLHLLRGSLSVLTMLGIVGTAFELATLQHWNGAMQLVPWAALLLLAAALALHAAAGGRASQTGLVRALALLVLAASLFGVMEHALVNYDAGPLDQRFAETWDALSPWLRWWYAITRTVGPAPTLAPGMLGQAATTLILATIGQRATFPESATRHRRHPYLSRLPRHGLRSRRRLCYCHRCRRSPTTGRPPTDQTPPPTLVTPLTTKGRRHWSD